MGIPIETKKQIIELYKKGMKPSEIRSKLGIPESMVRSIIRESK